MAKAICSGCGQIFGGESGFEKHRAGEFRKLDVTPSQRRCLTPQEMLARGLHQDERGRWIKDFDESVCTPRISKTHTSQKELS